MIEIESLPQLRGLTESDTHLTVIDFYADWCGPCQSAKPIFHQLGETFAATHRGKAVFCTCNVDHQPACARTWNITSLPTFLVLCGGRELLRDHSVDRLNRSLDGLLLQVRQTTASVPSPSGPGQTLAATSVKGLRDGVTAKMLQLESIRQASAAASSSSSPSSSSVEFSPAALTVITSISRLLHEGSTTKPFGLLLIPFLASSAPDGGGASGALEYFLRGMREQEGRDTGSTGLSTVPFSTLLVNNILRYVLQMALDLLWTDREEIDLLHHIFLSLLRSPVAESIIATSPYFISDAPGIFNTGVELEYQTILGAFFGLAPYSRLISSTFTIGQPQPSSSLEEMTLQFFFPSASLSMGGGGGGGGRGRGGAGGAKGGPLLPSEEEMQLKTKEVQLIVDALALRNNALTKVLLRSKVLREPTLRFFSLALKLNEGHQKTMMKNLPLSSAYFLTQLQLVLLEAAKPIFDPFRDQPIYQETLDEGPSSSTSAPLPTTTTTTNAKTTGSSTKTEEEDTPEASRHSTALLPPPGPAKHPVATALLSRLPPSYLIDEDPKTGGALTHYSNEVERVMHFDADHPLPPLPGDGSPSLPQSSPSPSGGSRTTPPVAADGTTLQNENVSEEQRGAREEHKDPEPRQGDASSVMTHTGNPHTATEVPSSFPSSSASLSFPSAHPTSTTTTAVAGGMGKGKSSRMDKYKPMTHLFFLALRAMTVVTIPMIDQVTQLQREMDYFDRHLRQAGGQMRFDVRQQYLIRGLFVVRNGLLSGATQTKLRLTFLNDVALWLLCLMQVSFSTGVLPASPPIEWQYLPQEIVDAPIKGTALTDLSSMYVPHLNGLLLILMGNKVYFPKPHTHVFSYLLVRILHEPMSRDRLQNHMWFTRHIIKSCMLCYIAVEKAYYERVQVRYDLSTCLKHLLEIPSLSEAVREEFCDPRNPTLEQFSHMAVAELNEAIDEMIQSLKKMKKKQLAQAKMAANHTNANRATSAAPPTLSLSGAPGSGSSGTAAGGGGDGGNAQEEEESSDDTDDNDEEEEENDEQDGGEARQPQQRQPRGGRRRGTSYEELGHRLQSSISLFYSSTDLFISLSKCFPAGISQNMVAQQLAQVLARSLVTFAGKQSAQLKITDGAQFKFEPRRILCSLVSCLSPLSMRTSFVRCLCDCGTPKADIIDAIDRVVSRELVPSLQQMHLSRIKDAVIRLSDAVEEEQRLWEDAPDFALDALLSTPLTEPIALPAEVKDLENLVYVNKSTIHHLLLSDSKHPFTKEYLDEPMLELFNAKPEVMAAVKNREEKVKEWLQEAQKTRTNSA